MKTTLNHLSETSTPSDVAKTIALQIGRQAMAMLGAHDLVLGTDGLQFKIKGSRLAAYVRVTLEPTDTYRMEFWKMRGVETLRLVKIDNVFVSELNEIIEQQTGLRTKL